LYPGNGPIEACRDDLKVGTIVGLGVVGDLVVGELVGAPVAAQRTRGSQVKVVLGLEVAPRAVRHTESATFVAVTAEQPFCATVVS